MYVGGELPWLNLTHVRDDKLCRESFLQRHARSAVLLVCLAWCDVEVVGKVLVCFGQTLITCHFHGIFFSSHKREESVEKSSAIPPSQPLSRLYSFKQLSQNKWKKRFIANCECNWNVKAAAAMLESPKNRAFWFSNTAIIGVVPWIWIWPAEHRNQHIVIAVRCRALHHQ